MNDAPAPAAPRRPERTCAGCRAVRPKRELLRIVLPAEGPAAVDPTGKRNGRGAYLCRDRGTTCLTQARRRHALVRALRTTSDRIDWDSLAADLDTVPLEVLTSPR
ncbi:MAG TPA: YlxR family protein [Candidatus Dormibacteraeota bacterium]